MYTTQLTTAVKHTPGCVSTRNVRATAAALRNHVALAATSVSHLSAARSHVHAQTVCRGTKQTIAFPVCVIELNPMQTAYAVHAAATEQAETAARPSTEW